MNQLIHNVSGNGRDARKLGKSRKRGLRLAFCLHPQSAFEPYLWKLETDKAKDKAPGSI